MNIIEMNARYPRLSAQCNNVDQHLSNNPQTTKQKLSKLIKDWCLPLSPFLCGLLVGILTGGLALAIIIALWLTSNNGKTSTAMGTTTTTTTNITTVASLPPQCTYYSSINDPTRLATAAGGTASDLSLFSGTYVWYRFYGAGGTQIITSAPNYNQCGTYYSGWYAGTMPTYGNTFNGTVCYVFTSICSYSNMILVTNCGSYYVYGLIDPPVSYARYCTA